MLKLSRMRVDQALIQRIKLQDDNSHAGQTIPIKRGKDDPLTAQM